MSPRPAPSVRDETGLRFLDAGASLVDALLAAERRDDLPPRLRSLHFPAPLDWIRIEDVIREAQQGAAPISAKAFWNRWPDKDSFMVDLAIHAITYGGAGAAPGTLDLRATMVDTDATFAERIQALTGSVMRELAGSPRSYLLGHLAAVAHHAPASRRRWRTRSTPTTRPGSRSTRPSPQAPGSRGVRAGVPSAPRSRCRRSSTGC